MIKILYILLIALLYGGVAIANPLKVYILVGQSNMQGHARTSTLPYMASDPKAKALHDKIVDDKGKPRVYSNVYITAVSERGTSPQKKNGTLTVGYGKALTDESSFGPELGFGITMAENLNEPILIIKTAWGGKSLNTDFRAPSSGAYELPKERQADWDKYPNGVHGIPKESERPKWWKSKHTATGHYYRLMMQSIKEVLKDPSKVCPVYDAKEGYELAGMVWFQGWNDMCDSTTYPVSIKEDRFKPYTNFLADFIKDSRKELSAPKMPFVIGVMGVGGTMNDLKTGGGYEFRKAMINTAKLAEFKTNVSIVKTGKYWDFDIAKLDKVHGKNVRSLQKKFDEQLEVKFKDLDRAGRKKYHKEKGEFIDKGLAKIFKEKHPKLDYQKLKSGKANAGYHYLGSGKTIAKIGEAFANSLIK